MDRPTRRSNCLLFAVAAWLRLGGYVLARRSRWGPFPHFLWADPQRRHVVSFVPDRPIPTLLPPPLFKGRMRWGD